MFDELEDIDKALSDINSIGLTRAQSDYLFYKCDSMRALLLFQDPNFGFKWNFNYALKQYCDICSREDGCIEFHECQKLRKKRKIMQLQLLRVMIVRAEYFI